uniref:Beta-sarcoglycan n=1 Tax=Arion vulgaris TaxID=1028688 RepID=A0A0B7A6Q9_9EUPU
MNISTHTTMSNVDSDPGISTGDVSMVGVRSDPQSPMSVGQLGASTLSMRAKAVRKRKVNAQHNSNFRAGFVLVEEEALHRTGIRGRKRYFLYCILTVMMFTALLNTLVIAWLLYIFGMSHHGMASIELTTIGGRDFLRVLAEARIITMSFNDAALGARYNSTLFLESKETSLEVKSTFTKSGSSIKMEGSNITLTTDEFGINVNGSDDWVLANLPSLVSHNTISNLFVDNVTASKIHGTKDFKDLYIESSQNIEMKSAEGFNIKSNKIIDIYAFNVYMNTQTSINIDAKHGLYLTGLPVVTTSDFINRNLLTHKVCICRTGQVFTVPVTRPGITCDIGQQLQKICGQSV